MENQIQVFNHPQFGEVNTIRQEDGTVLFKANDVAAALGYSQPKVAICKLCKGVTILETPYENQCGTVVMQPTKYITEADVYRLVMRSKLPEAERFQDWVCEEVLPSIRQNGMYLTTAVARQMVANPDFLISLGNEIKEEQQLRAAVERKYEEQRLLIGNQQKRIDELHKRTSYVELVLQDEGLLDITQIAQDYGMSAIKMNALLHEWRIQYKDNGQWILYADYKNKGFVQSCTIPVERGKMKMHTRWTQKGRLFLYHLLKSKGFLPLVEENTMKDEGEKCPKETTNA